MNRLVHKVILTGGPCGGKSTALKVIKQHYEKNGWRVFPVKEVASFILKDNVPFSEFNKEQKIKFQENMLKSIMTIEQTCFDLARLDNKNSLVVCDRGTIDTLAFLSKRDWQGMLFRNGWRISDLREKRYDQVIHMVTAAIGQEKFYTCENNKARTETPEMARMLDEKLRMLWSGHHCYEIVHEESSLQEKIDKVINIIHRRLNKIEEMSKRLNNCGERTNDKNEFSRLEFRL